MSQGSGEAPDAGDTAQPPQPAPAAPVSLNAVALAQEVALERLERFLERLLAALRRYRARRGNWWEK